MVIWVEEMGGIMGEEEVAEQEQEVHPYMETEDLHQEIVIHLH